ncbi:MAG: hypothetical protein HYV34_02745 [Candidatus Kerfeldbacteria bacterium]|nr:hypothetical protein [Candidatus Kerfeldbacteria bacterium]
MAKQTGNSQKKKFSLGGRPSGTMLLVFFERSFFRIGLVLATLAIVGSAALTFRHIQSTMRQNQQSNPTASSLESEQKALEEVHAKKLQLEDISTESLVNPFE